MKSPKTTTTEMLQSTLPTVRKRPAHIWSDVTDHALESEKSSVAGLVNRHRTIV